MLGSTLLFSFVQDRQQKFLFASMSVIFIPFILRVPAGVGIYWITTNLWTICQQGIVKRTMGHHFPAVQKEEKQKHAQQPRSSRNPPKADAAAKADGAKPAAKPAAKKPAARDRARSGDERASAVRGRGDRRDGRARRAGRRCTSWSGGTRRSTGRRRVRGRCPRASAGLLGVGLRAGAGAGAAHGSTRMRRRRRPAPVGGRAATPTTRPPPRACGEMVGRVLIAMELEG